MSTEKKNKLISASVTTGVMALLFIFMLFCGFTHQVPPPPAKKVILIELDEEVGGGGGGGGTPQQAPKVQPAPATNSAVTTNDATAPATNYTKSPTPQHSNTPSQPTPTTPKVNQNALFPSGSGGGSGTGKGTGTGSGSGSGRGTGIGTGDGAGNGGGIGYGTGSRGYRRAPDISLDVTESGTVYVEVEIDETGNVIAAKVLSSNKYPTSITSSSIREECVRRAKGVKYISGKHEYRVIMFTNK